MVWGLVVGWNHVKHPKQHRIYYDEDVYANMAFNMLHGYGGTVTKAWADSQKQVRFFKWPIGFPAFMMPFVAWAGTERGPKIFNEVCESLTLLLMMALTARLAANGLAGHAVVIFYGMHPVVGGWYRSGASEPLALLMLVLSFWAATESYYRSQNQNGDGADWMVVAFISGFIALHIRLENIIVTLPLFILFRKSQIKFSNRHVALFLMTGGALLLSFVIHVLSLKKYYLMNLPESRFSMTYFPSNLMSNLKFMIKYSPWPMLLFAAIAFLIYIKWQRGNEKPSNVITAWIAWMLIPVSHFVLLLFYSVGRYDVAGGSRFFLLQMAGLSVMAAVLLSKISPNCFRVRMMTAVLAGYFILLPNREEVWNQFNEQNTSPALEHAQIQNWSRSLPEQVVVISRLPFLWEHFECFSISPEIRNRNLISRSNELYLHRGLFDQLQTTSLKTGMAVDSIETKHGTIILLKIP